MVPKFKNIRDELIVRNYEHVTQVANMKCPKVSFEFLVFECAQRTMENEPKEEPEIVVDGLGNHLYFSLDK